MREHDPHPFDGRRPAGELRPPGDADGAGADRLPALHAGDEARPGAARLAGPRPLRALLRPRVDAPLLDALPRRLRHHAGPDQEVPPDRLAGRGASRVRPRPGRGDDHRPARPGHLDRGRHGARRAHDGRPLQQGRPHAGRQPHVLHRVRRRPRGGHRVGVVLARRPPRPRQADRLLRRQPHLDRGRHRAGVLRGRRQALRGLRLARPEPARGHRARQPRGRDHRGAGRHGPAVADHRPHAHRARLAEQAGHPRRARLAARRGGDPAHQGGLRLPEPRAVLRPRGGARPLPRVRRPRPRAAGGLAGGVRGVPRRSSRPRRPSSSAACPRRLPAGLRRRRPEEGPGRRHDRHAQGLQRGHPVGGRRGARDGRRLRRPRAVDADADRRRRERRGRRLRRAQPALRHPRARHGRGRQRPDAVRASARTAPASSSSATT